MRTFNVLDIKKTTNFIKQNFSETIISIKETKYLVTHNALVPSTVNKFLGKMTCITMSREVDNFPPFYSDGGEELL